MPAPRIKTLVHALLSAATLTAGCAIPCVDDGFLGMQQDPACMAAPSSTGTATTTTAEATAETSTETSASTGTMLTTGTDASEVTTDAVTSSTTACSCVPSTSETATSDTSTSDTSDTGTGDTSASDTSTSDTGTSDTDPGSSSGMPPGECGDMIVDMGEQCDDGNPVEVDACNSFCRSTPLAISESDADLTAIEGGVGGSPYDDPCDPGELLIGFEGALDDMERIGQISGRCAAPLVNDDGLQFFVTLAPTSDLPVRGMNNLGGPWQAACAADSAVVGFRGQESQWIDQLVLRCAPIEIAVTMQGDYSLALGPVSELPVVGNNVLGVPFAAVDCPAGQVADHQRGLAGQVVDAFGLGCATLALEF